MDIMELGAIGELVGGVAVSVTLIYLASFQVRQATKVAKAQVHHETSRMTIEVLLRADRATLDLYDQAVSDPESVSDSDWNWSATTGPRPPTTTKLSSMHGSAVKSTPTFGEVACIGWPISSVPFGKSSGTHESWPRARSEVWLTPMHRGERGPTP